MVLVTTSRRISSIRTAPRTAILLASVPPPVKDDLVRRGADQRCDLGAGGFYRVVGTAAKTVRRRRIAELAAQKGQHGVEHRGVDRRGGIVVEIDRGHRRFTILKM